MTLLGINQNYVAPDNLTGGMLSKLMGRVVQGHKHDGEGYGEGDRVVVYPDSLG